MVTLLGIAIIGLAGSMKSKSLSEEEKKKAVKDFNFTKGIIVALLAGFMSACFNIGLGFGEHLNFGEATDPMFRTLPATLLVTIGGFVTNAVYCFYQNGKNNTWKDYSQTRLYANNIMFCALAGLLWYSQFFGLSLGKGFLTGSTVLLTFSWCILMALNVTFSNVWGIILKEWKGCSKQTIAVLIAGSYLVYSIVGLITVRHPVGCRTVFLFQPYATAQFTSPALRLRIRKNGIRIFHNIRIPRQKDS